MPTQFPSYLNGPNTGELQQTYRSIPRAFDTSGVENAYQNQMGMNLAQAKTTTGAMGRAAESRAFQSGGKVGSSFAAADAMLPYFQQNQQQMGDLADYKLRAAQSRLAAQTGIGNSLAGFREGNQGMRLQYDLAGQQRAQQGGQFDRTLSQNAAQFGAQNSLALRQQGFEERKYADALRLQQSGGYGGRGGSDGLPSWGNVAAIMGAQNAALGQGRAANFWQQTGTAARQGGFEDTPVFGTGSPGGYGAGWESTGGGPQARGSYALPSAAAAAQGAWGSMRGGLF